MIKKLLRFFTGAREENRVVDSHVEGLHELESFVDYVVKSLVDAPDCVRICSMEGDNENIIQIHCKKEDIGKIVGKKGKTIMAIRSLVSGAAGRLQKRVAVEVVD